jgi:hypothetical protein
MALSLRATPGNGKHVITAYRRGLLCLGVSLQDLFTDASTGNWEDEGRKEKNRIQPSALASMGIYIIHDSLKMFS